MVVCSYFLKKGRKMRKRNVHKTYEYGLVLHKESQVFKEDVYKRIGLNKIFLHKKILDLGCGHGTDSIVLENFANRVIGVDIQSYKEWKILKTKKIKYIKANASRLPFKDNAFDGVYLKDLLHHVKNVDAILHEINRVTKKNGKIVILEANRYNPILYLYATLMMGHDHFTQKEFEKLVINIFPKSKFVYLEAYPPFRFPMKIYKLILWLEKKVNKLSFLNLFFAYNIALIKNVKTPKKK